MNDQKRKSDYPLSSASKKPRLEELNMVWESVFNDGSPPPEDLEKNLAKYKFMYQPFEEGWERYEEQRKNEEIQNDFKLVFKPAEMKILQEVFTLDAYHQVKQFASSEPMKAKKALLNFELNERIVSQFLNRFCQESDETTDASNAFITKGVSSDFFLDCDIHRSGFYPFSTIYVRESYKQLWKIICERGKENCSTIIIGDPGTGKTTLLRYCFQMVLLTLTKQKVFWAMENHDWVYYDGTGGNAKIGTGPSHLWKKKDVWLFIDGHCDDTFLYKEGCSVLFSSPKKSNYLKFQKTSDALSLVNNPWSLSEVSTLFFHNTPSDDKEGNTSFLGHELLKNVSFKDEIDKREIDELEENNNNSNIKNEKDEEEEEEDSLEM